MIIKYTCMKCHHTWVPNKQNPKRCPSCQTKDWNPNPDLTEREVCLTETESLALLWISKNKGIPTNEIIKQRGSPDFYIPGDHSSFEVKTVFNRAIYISRKQIDSITKSCPDCLLIAFKRGIDDPVLIKPVAEIKFPEEFFDSDIGRLHIRVSDYS